MQLESLPVIPGPSNFLLLGSLVRLVSLLARNRVLTFKQPMLGLDFICSKVIGDWMPPWFILVLEGRFAPLCSTSTVLG